MCAPERVNTRPIPGTLRIRPAEEARQSCSIGRPAERLEDAITVLAPPATGVIIQVSVILGPLSLLGPTGWSLPCLAAESRPRGARVREGESGDEDAEGISDGETKPQTRQFTPRPYGRGAELDWASSPVVDTPRGCAGLSPIRHTRRGWCSCRSERVSRWCVPVPNRHGDPEHQQPRPRPAALLRQRLEIGTSDSAVQGPLGENASSL